MHVPFFVARRLDCSLEYLNSPAVATADFKLGYNPD